MNELASTVLVFCFQLCLIVFFILQARGSSARLLNEKLLQVGVFKGVCQITYCLSASFLASQLAFLGVSN